MSITRRELAIELWHGPLPAPEIAALCNYSSVRALLLFWQRRKIDGTLPDADRPNFAPLNGAAICDDDPAVDLSDIIAFSADGEVIKGAPLGGEIGLGIPPGDPLLCALRLCHGAESWRHLDGMPAQTLEMEKLTPPSRARVAEFAAIRDLLTAALMQRAMR